MPVDPTTWAWAQTTKASAKLVLLSIARSAADDLSCKSQAQIACDTGLSIRSVRRALAELERDHFLEVIENHGSGTGRLSNQYRLATGQNDRLPDLTETVIHRQGDNMSGATGQPVRPMAKARLESKEGQPSHSQGRRSSSDDLEMGLAGLPELDWQRIAREERPDITNPERSWRAFVQRCVGESRSLGTWARRWRSWIAREKTYSSKHASIANSNRAPGSFLKTIDEDAMPADYRVIHEN